MIRYLVICLVLLLESVIGIEINIKNAEVIEFKDALLEDIFSLDRIKTIINENIEINYDADTRDDCPAKDTGNDDVVPRVSVGSLGTARGRTMKNFLGNEIFAFQSIPYAVPPEGDLRFKMTTLWEEPWDTESNGIEGDYDATYIRAKCPQSSLLVPIPGGRENCLFISIYTPNTVIENPDVKYPVMFFIHGGGFISGDFSLYQPTKLMDEDVVVVTVQYRLGTLGFLAAQTPDNPGNMGLMDQVLALRWIQKYISYFGGDPESVTVFGQSAGGTSTSWLQFTDTTTAESNNGKQLLHRGIVHSGSAIEVWAQDPDPTTSFRLEAEELNCWDDSDPQNAVENALDCMRSKPVQEVVTGFLTVCSEDMQEAGLGFLGVSPVVQNLLIENYPDEIEEDPDLVVIKDDPFTLIAEGDFLHIPLMMGSVRDEGSLVLGLVYNDYLVMNDLEDDEMFLKIKLLPTLVDSFGITDKTGAVSNSFKLTFLRYAEMGIWNSMSSGLVDMTGMLFLKTGLWTLTQLLTSKNPDNPIFFYSFEFESDDSLFDWFFSPDIPIEGGITHADDLQYLFCMTSFVDERETDFIYKFTRLWSNFAACGDPTPTDECGYSWDDIDEKWEPFSFESLSFMLIQDEFHMESDFTLRWNHNTLPDPGCLSYTDLRDE